MISTRKLHTASSLILNSINHSEKYSEHMLKLIDIVACELKIKLFESVDFCHLEFATRNTGIVSRISVNDIRIFSLFRRGRDNNFYFIELNRPDIFIVDCVLSELEKNSWMWGLSHNKQLYLINRTDYKFIRYSGFDGYMLYNYQKMKAHASWILVEFEQKQKVPGKEIWGAKSLFRHDLPPRVYTIQKDKGEFIQIANEEGYMLLARCPEGNNLRPSIRLYNLKDIEVASYPLTSRISCWTYCLRNKFLFVVTQKKSPSKSLTSYVRYMRLTWIKLVHNNTSSELTEIGECKWSNAEQEFKGVLKISATYSTRFHCWMIITLEDWTTRTKVQIYIADETYGHISKVESLSKFYTLKNSPISFVADRGSIYSIRINKKMTQYKL